MFPELSLSTAEPNGSAPETIVSITEKDVNMAESNVTAAETSGTVTESNVTIAELNRIATELSVPLLQRYMLSPHKGVSIPQLNVSLQYRPDRFPKPVRSETSFKPAPLRR
jgi:hypothetical protein